MIYRNRPLFGPNRKRSSRVPGLDTVVQNGGVVVALNNHAERSKRAGTAFSLGITGAARPGTSTAGIVRLDPSPGGAKWRDGRSEGALEATRPSPRGGRDGCLTVVQRVWVQLMDHCTPREQILQTPLTREAPQGRAFALQFHVKPRVPVAPLRVPACLTMQYHAALRYQSFPVPHRVTGVRIRQSHKLYHAKTQSL